MRKLVALSFATTLAACGGSSGHPGSDAGLDAGLGGGSDGGSDGGGGPHGQPITGLPSETWTWVPIDGAICRDFSPTGIGVNLNPNSTKLMIFLEGGGACFNIPTCASNPATFGGSDFQTNFGASGAEASAGIFNRADPANPVADWSFVYIPYCTGDIHAGDLDGGTTSDGVGPEAFVGYRNVALDLARIAPTFPNVTEVLLTGASAGGFGALLNYDQVAAAFPGVPVQLLDDSGPPMATGPGDGGVFLSPCLQEEVSQTWNLADTVIADCGADCAGDAGFALPYLMHVVSAHPDRAFGLVDSTADGVISEFFGFGLADCAGGNAISPAVYEQGLLDIRTQLASEPNFGLFAFGGTKHTSLEGGGFDTRTAGDGGLLLTAWTAEIVDGGVTNAGP